MRTFQSFYIQPKFRLQKYLQQLAFFIKKLYKCKYLKLGDVHSKATIEIIQHFLKTGRFKVLYQNQQGELHLFDFNTVYSDEKPTGNSVVLEGHDFYNTFPVFTDLSDPIKSSTSWIVDEK